MGVFVYFTLEDRIKKYKVYMVFETCKYFKCYDEMILAFNLFFISMKRSNTFCNINLNKG